MIQKEGYRVNSRRLTKIFFHELHFESFLQGLELTCSALEMVNGIEQADTPVATHARIPFVQSIWTC